MVLDSVALLRERVSEVLDRIRDSNYILTIFSDDGDGLASALLLKLLYDEIGVEYSFICLDKVYPDIITDIEAENYDLMIFTDLGGAFYKYFGAGENIVIIDHHAEAIAPPEDILYINPSSYGFDESEAPSSSIITYLVCKHYDAGLFGRWSWIAVLGYGESPNYPVGLNWRIMYEAIKNGVVVKKGDAIKIIHGSINKDYRRLYREVTLISSAGYYEDAYLDLFQVLVEGDNRYILDKASEYREVRKKVFGEMIGFLEGEGLSEKNAITWFEDYKNLFYKLGTRVFDSFTSYVSYQVRLYDRNKYLLGLCERNPYIPGYGYLPRDWINIAVRASRSMAFKISLGRRQPVSALVEASAFTVGGLGYGYSDKGSAVIPYGEKDGFLALFNDLASQRV